MQTEQISTISAIPNLPKITSFLLSHKYELLPNTSELFELEFAFYEYKFLEKDEIVDRGAFFKSVNGELTGWYVRRGDLKRMVEAYDFVFTFSKDELERFSTLLQDIFHEK